MKIVDRRYSTIDLSFCMEDGLEYIRKVIDDISRSKNTETRVGIDGMSASGKTSITKWLSQQFECNVYHMDDFFLQPYQRTKARLKEVGGNVDYERFYDEIIVPLQEKKDITYRPYSCKEGRITSSSVLPNANIHIIEGAYSHHPRFQDSYDLKIFIGVSDQIQTRRIRKRNGDRILERFQQEWIPKEIAYFNWYHTEENSHISIWLEE